MEDGTRKGGPNNPPCKQISPFPNAHLNTLQSLCWWWVSTRAQRAMCVHQYKVYASLEDMCDGIKKAEVDGLESCELRASSAGQLCGNAYPAVHDLGIYPARGYIVVHAYMLFFLYSAYPYVPFFSSWFSTLSFLGLLPSQIVHLLPIPKMVQVMHPLRLGPPRLQGF